MFSYTNYFFSTNKLLNEHPLIHYIGYTLIIQLELLEMMPMLYLAYCICVIKVCTGSMVMHYTVKGDLIHMYGMSTI